MPGDKKTVTEGIDGDHVIQQGTFGNSCLQMTHKADTILHLTALAEELGKQKGLACLSCYLLHVTDCIMSPLVHMLKPYPQCDCQNVTIFGEKVFKEVIKLK